MMFQGTVLFGGAFDPPHLGHVDCLKILYKAFPSVTAVVVPASMPPNVEDSHSKVKSPKSSWRERYALCRLTFGNFFPANQVLVSDIESKLPEPNFTINTIDYFLRSGLTDIALLLGWDQFSLFHKWHRVNDILKKANIIVINRDESLNAKDAMKSFESHVGVGYEWRVNDQCAQLKTGTAIFFLNGKTSPISSRVLREKMQLDMKDPEAVQYLESESYEYISKHKLYG
ncbi:MAG: nicotinate-nicotinamide nucleotide adenylyltransferase [Oligoflexales bacterium]